DALECEVVGGLGDHPQIGQRIAYFGPFVEPKTADNPVVEADLYEPIFEFAGLVLRAYEDRDLLERRPFALEPLDLLAHAAGFLGRIPHTVHADLLARMGVGPQRLAEPLAVRREEAGGGGEDLRRGAIVLLQPDHSRAGKVLFEPQDIG